MKLIYTPHEPIPVLINPSELFDGEEGTIVRWFEKTNSYVGRKMWREGHTIYRQYENGTWNLDSLGIGELYHLIQIRVFR